MAKEANTKWWAVGGEPLRSTRLRRRFAAVLAVLPLALLSSAAIEGQVGTSQVVTGLSSPTYVVAPGDDFNRIFVTEQGGSILIQELDTGLLLATPFLTVPGVDGQGLQGLAFDPDYDVNGHLYVYYSATGPLRSVIERYTRNAADPDLADPASARLVLEIAQPFDNHNGGWIGFGPDGLLYAPMGDGGSQCDPFDHGQRLDTLLGAVLRLDVHRDDFPGDPDRNYAIPADNPFVGQAGRDEIWSYGLRNPFRSSFDRQSGDLYIADVGQNFREEVDYQPAGDPGGANYGWRLREGEIETPMVDVCEGGPPPPGNVEPIYTYTHGTGSSQGNSVTGGYVYRGPETEIQGEYFFGDFVNERIWSFEAGTGSGFTDWTTAFAPATGAINQIVSFGEDGFANLYIVDYGGEVFRVEGPVGFVPCPDRVLTMDDVGGTEIIEHCRNVALGPEFSVAPGGDLTLRVGNRVVFRNGVAIDGELLVEIDPALQQIPP